METYKKIEEIIERMRPDSEKFFEKGNHAAGTRLRAACQELRELAKLFRSEIQEAKKAE